MYIFGNETNFWPGIYGIDNNILYWSSYIALEKQNIVYV